METKWLVEIGLLIINYLAISNKCCVKRMRKEVIMM